MVPTLCCKIMSQVYSHWARETDRISLSSPSLSLSHQRISPSLPLSPSLSLSLPLSPSLCVSLNLSLCHSQPFSNDFKMDFSSKKSPDKKLSVIEAVMAIKPFDKWSARKGPFKRGSLFTKKTIFCIILILNTSAKFLLTRREIFFYKKFVRGLAIFPHYFTNTSFTHRWQGKDFISFNLETLVNATLS